MPDTPPTAREPVPDPARPVAVHLVGGPHNDESVHVEEVSAVVMTSVYDIDTNAEWVATYRRLGIPARYEPWPGEVSYGFDHTIGRFLRLKGEDPRPRQTALRRALDRHPPLSPVAQLEEPDDMYGVRWTACWITEGDPEP